MEAKKVLFVCDRHPELQMVYKRDTTVIVDGVVVKSQAEYVRFLKTPYGGQFETDDAKHIAYVRGSPQYKQGLIVEVADIDQLRKNDQAPERVVAGMIGTAPRAPQPAMPAPAREGASAPGAVKVPAFVAADDDGGGWSLR